ncbi:hypothetical protein [Micromonospora sp. NPDC047730]|uniref:hypothetical protein n=1 Tax=Micromonospora sp. NPDC047730 TaxID=3364253 RepID=UPI00371DDD97
MNARKIGAPACLLMIALGASACADQGQPDAPTPSTSATSAAPAPTRSEIQVAKHYLTADELRADIEAKTNINCGSWKPVANPIGARERAACTEGIVLSIYRSRSDAKDSAASVGEMIAGTLEQKSIHVIGDTWGVNCGDNEACGRDVAEALKGEVLVFTPE